MTSYYDYIVVGGGIIGSWTAYHLAKDPCVKGKKSVLMLDQYPLPHNRGSSAGQTRASHVEDLGHMMPDAFREWRQLEKSVGYELRKKCGRLSFANDTSAKEQLNSFAKFLHKNGHNHEILNVKLLLSRYPMLKYPHDTEIVFEPDSQIVLVQKSLEALRNQIQAEGGEIREQTKVLGIYPGDFTPHVRVVSENSKKSEVLKAGKVLLCTGAWSNLLVSDLNLPLKVVSVAATYWRENEPGTYSIGNGFPNLAHRDAMIYSVPSYEYPGMMKVGSMYGVSIKNGGDRDLHDHSAIIKQISDYVREHLPGLDASKPAAVDYCIYTVTPDWLPFIDRHPDYPETIFMGFGFSGMGFKSSPATGKLLAFMAMGKMNQLDYDNEMFRIDRFRKSKI